MQKFIAAGWRSCSCQYGLRLRRGTNFVLRLRALIVLAATSGAASAQTFTTLLSFSGNNGANPVDLTLSGATLYGTTEDGGASGYGTVFSLPVSGGTPTTLLTFSTTNGNGVSPTRDLTLSGSTLYGMTSSGGTKQLGTVFSLPVSGGPPTVLLSFSGSNGQDPLGGLTLSGSTLYGMTAEGGANGDGTVFSIPVSGGAPTTLLSFSASAGVPRMGV